MSHRPRQALTAASCLHWIAAAAAAALSWASAAVAEDFYAGRQITYIVGAGVGGGYDLQARVTARHLPKHIPGNPAIVVQNMPARIAAANHMFTTAPKDGTHIALIQRGMLLAKLIYPSGTRFEIEKFNWLGSLNSEVAVTLAWHTAPHKTAKDLFDKELIVGGIVGVDPETTPRLLNALIGTKFKIVSGYNGVAQLNLAMERGEIQGRGASWISVVASKPAYIAEKKLKPLVVDGLTRDPLIPHVPRLIELAKSDRERQAVTLISASAEFGRAVFAPPGTPADRLAALRRAFDAAIKDPALLAEAKKRKLVIEPQDGAKVQKTATDVISASPEAIAYARQLMGSK
jgi:tripartite-type tricarboxylate transporter receptor subunit TctC